jgi:maleylpyruvate isomerase
VHHVAVDDVLAELTRRTALLCDALDDADLDAPSLLPGWSRLTIACHLRYGAEAMTWMTRDTVAGRETAYYPDGRETQRPATLLPRGDEDVVASLRATAAALDDAFAAVRDWDANVSEPADNPDLGTFPLWHIPLYRLTEVEVHGTDLDIGLGPWSDTLVERGLAVRFHRLRQRAPQAPGAWRVRDVVVGDGSEPEVIDGTDRELFAILIGRADAGAFTKAFPGP